MSRAAVSPAAAAARAILAAAVIAALVSGCAADAPPSPTVTIELPAPSGAAELPAGVRVELRQSRADVAARQAALSVRNESTEPVEIGAVAVTDPRFASAVGRVIDRTSTVPAGATVDVRLQLPAVDCAVGDDASATAEIDWKQGGESGRASVAVHDPVPFLADLHHRECVEEAVRHVATIELGELTAASRPEPGVLRLHVTPTGNGGDLLLTGIRETNLFTFGDVVDGVRRLDVDLTGRGTDALSIDLPIVPLRCDAHAVQEDKRGTVFRLFVEIDGAAGSFDLAASPELRGRLLDGVAEWCGF